MKQLPYIQQYASGTKIQTAIENNVC